MLLISCQVSRGLNNFPLLFALMRVVSSLLLNPHIHIEPYVSSPLVDLVYLFIFLQTKYDLCLSNLVLLIFT